MSDFKQKPNTASIFKNENKTDKLHPDYKGIINIDGKELDIALWVRESESGKKYFSGKISEKWVKPEVEQSAKSSAKEDSGLPF